MIFLAHMSALLAILGVGVVYGTDFFCALVLRPALARVDDHVLTIVTGNVHRYGDQRMPVPGAIGLVASAASTVLALLGGNPLAAITTGAALALLLMWMILYTRISAPINRVLTGAADNHTTPTNTRELQTRWDSIIVLRATLQGLALLALSLSLLTN
jgi:hypothetical protein